ncbi:hypothetical protein [Novosphingobium barchaimii]|uniref:hypothetical protein n=1 Tax=Novosphingobium barchaimii TaxID=1420591 RepID=UPI0011DF6A12|nr:hypothetical protein [Novosphingobium barchaimii]
MENVVINTPASPETGSREDTLHDDQGRLAIIIDHLRAAHQAGMSLDEISSHLEPVLATAQARISSENMALVPFPLSVPNPATEEIALDQRCSPGPGSEVWQSPATRSNRSTALVENAIDQAGLPPRGASRDFPCHLSDMRIQPERFSTRAAFSTLIDFAVANCVFGDSVSGIFPCDRTSLFAFGVIPDYVTSDSGARGLLPARGRWRPSCAAR